MNYYVFSWYVLTQVRRVDGVKDSSVNLKKLVVNGRLNQQEIYFRNILRDNMKKSMGDLTEKPD